MIKLIKNWHRGFIGGPDFSIPAERVVLLGNKQLSINIPESNVVAAETARDKYFPHDSVTWFKEHSKQYFQHEYVTILIELWMYLPVISVGTSSEYGMLSCHPRIKQTDKIDVTDLGSLSHFVTQEYESFHNGLNGKNSKIREQVKERLDNKAFKSTEEELQKEIDGWILATGKPPIPPAEIKRIGSLDWVFYKECRSNSLSYINYYCLPLGKNSFLEILFNYRVDRSDRYKKWAKHAEESEMRIMESVTLTDIPEEQINLLN